MKLVEIIPELEERLEKIRRDEPYARNIISAYEAVISDLLNDEETPTPEA